MRFILDRFPLPRHVGDIHETDSNAEYDPKKLIKAFKKEFACNGTVVSDDEAGQVIQLQGDQRQKIAAFLAEEVGIPKNTIKVHGF